MLDFRVSSHTHFDDACRKFAASHNVRAGCKGRYQAAYALQQAQPRTAAPANSPRNMDADRPDRRFNPRRWVSGSDSLSAMCAS